MDISLEKVAVSIFMFLLTALTGWWAWWQRRTQSTVENHDQRITRLEEKMVTADEVRSIVHQGNEPVMAQLQELSSRSAENNANISALLLRFAEREGYEKALKELRNENNSSNN
jgi:hypothetical protein